MIDDNGSKESKEPDYNEDKNQLEEKQEEETGEVSEEKETTNEMSELFLQIIELQP